METPFRNTFAEPLTSATSVPGQSNGGNSSVSHVIINPGVRIDLLPRGKGDSTVRVAKTEGDLRIGMYIMAAIQGRTRISFYKLPESVVRKELDRLQSSGQEYGLVVTDSPPLATPSAPPQLMSPSALASPALVVENVRKMTPVYPLPPATATTNGGRRRYSSQEDVDHGSTMGVGMGNLSQGYSEEEDEIYRLGTGLSGMAGANDLPSLDKAFLESVERLRSQRRAVEVIKRESQQKTLKIESLMTESRQLQQELAEAREAYESLRRSSTTTDSLEDALAFERSRNLKLEKDYEKLRADTKASESRLAEELGRVKQEREEERVALQNALEESRLHHNDALLRIEELKRSLIQSNQERDAAEAREEQTRRASERLIVEQRERDVKSEHAMERLRVERDKAMRRGDELESLLAVARGQISAQRDAADNARERFAVLDRTVNELEENCRELRTQLAETESRTASRVRDFETEIERLKRELDSVLEIKEESRKTRDEIRVALDEEIRAHRTTREELVAMEASKREAEEACERAMRQAKSANERVTEISHQKDLLHDRLVKALAKGNALADELEEERRAGKVLAETRLELLSQFVEEERRLDGTLMMATHPPPSAVQRRRAERKLEFPSPGKPPSSAASSHTTSFMRRPHSQPTVPETPVEARSRGPPLNPSQARYTGV